METAFGGGLFFCLSVNAKSAKSLGIDVPPRLLGLADEVVEQTSALFQQRTIVMVWSLPSLPGTVTL